MDYKDKLKLAKEALDSGSYDKETIKYIFPELAESEDERISREITEFIVNFHNGNYEKPYDYTIRTWLAWLEKQSEKPFDYENANIHQKDFAPQVDGFDAELNTLLKKYEHLPKKEVTECLSFYLGVVQGEHKPKWTEEDESKVKEIIYFLDTAKVHYASTTALDDCIEWVKSLKQRMEE